MQKISAAFAVMACLFVAAPAGAPTFAKKNYNKSEWTNGRF
jgi:hypothetical protein